MIPEKFPESNVVFAENQPEYLPMPARLDEDGTVTICWKLTWRERFRLLWTGRLWQQVLTFNKPIQPQRLETKNPL